MKKIIVGILSITGVLAIIVAGLMWFAIQNTDYKWTGEELFTAVNEYRASQGLSTIELDPILCDNLVERYLAIKEPGNAHKGYEEWLKAEEILGNPKYGSIGEMYVTDTSTTNNAIASWLSSPGHKSTLEMKEMKYGCTYASDGTGVLIMATEE